MIYRRFIDKEISALGMGSMRFPVLDGDNSKIDTAQVQKMVDYAMAHGVNYYDTAWGYHDGHSEGALCAALSKYPRESYFLADKFPGYDLSNIGKAPEIFEEQLRRCGTDHFDFYLLHNVCELNLDAYLSPANGLMSYLREQRKNGRIRRLGFSIHAGNDGTRRFMDAYGTEMEFCQIQMNYVDWSFQAAQEKLEIMMAYNLPVWVMEPLRGGMLAHLSPENEAKLRALRPDETIPGWAFRFLQGLPRVITVLSGMSNYEQLKQNIATFERERPLNDMEQTVLLDMADGMIKAGSLPCTACRYCTAHCPMQLDIPALIRLYNEHKFTGGGYIAPMALMALPEEKRPSSCIGCRNCEIVCPQQLKIADAFADFSAMTGL